MVKRCQWANSTRRRISNSADLTALNTLVNHLGAEVGPWDLHDDNDKQGYNRAIGARRAIAWSMTHRIRESFDAGDGLCGF